MKLWTPAAVVFMSLALYNCGEGGSSTDNSKVNDPAKNPPSAGLSDSWFGSVTKCLSDAEEVRTVNANGSSSLTVKQTVVCSPVMSGADEKDVTAKLDQWKKANCSDKIFIRNGTQGYYQGCWIVPFGALNSVSTSKVGIESRMADAEFCGGTKTSNYGSIRCK